MVRPLPGSYVFEANRVLDAELGPESLHLVHLVESLSHPFRAFLFNFSLRSRDKVARCKETKDYGFTGSFTVQRKEVSHPTMIPPLMSGQQSIDLRRDPLYRPVIL